MARVDTSTWFHDEDRFDSIELDVLVQHIAVELKLCLVKDDELLSMERLLERFDLSAVKKAFAITVPMYHKGVIRGGTMGLMAYTHAVLKNNCKRMTM